MTPSRKDSVKIPDRLVYSSFFTNRKQVEGQFVPARTEKH